MSDFYVFITRGLKVLRNERGRKGNALVSWVRHFQYTQSVLNEGELYNSNIFTTFLLKKCLFIYTYWHFESEKKPCFRIKITPYIGICNLSVLLLSGTPRVRIAPGTPIPRKHCVFGGLLFLKLLLPNCASSFHAMHTIIINSIKILCLFPLYDKVIQIRILFITTKEFAKLFRLMNVSNDYIVCWR